MKDESASGKLPVSIKNRFSLPPTKKQLVPRKVCFGEKLNAIKGLINF
jgi:hypothetical protein